MQADRTSHFPPLVPVDGVLTVDGFGIRVHVRHGRLIVEDGLGRDRRCGEFSRATGGIKRLAIIGHEGYVTLEAMRWLDGVGAALLQIDRDGSLIAAWGKQGNDDPRLRRAQASAFGTPRGASIARMLLEHKIDGQAKVLRRLGGNADAAGILQAAISNLEGAAVPEELMRVEAAAASAYWGTWASVPVPFVRKDQERVPAHWRSFGKRVSPLTGSPRLAANPANALLNYLYAVLEAECRIACLGIGLDPGLGVLHADQRSRDSMALDLMEAVRPEVDAFVLDLLEGHIFRARDFRETRDGNCRILAPLTHALTQTAPRWRRAVAPVAERVARMLLNGEQATKLLPTHLTGDNRSRARELHRKGSRKVPRQTRPRLPRACAVCGQLLDRRASDRILCADCLTERRIEAGVRIATAGPAALAKLRLEGLDPAHGGPAKAKRVAALARNQARIRAFEEASTVGSDAEVFRREILPGIKDLGLGELVRATGLTAGYLSRVRRGLVVPHSMHWPALAAAAAEASREPEV